MTIGRIHVVMWGSNYNSYGGHVGLPDKRSSLKFFSKGTPVYVGYAYKSVPS